jgi:hypothetical protein
MELFSWLADIPYIEVILGGVLSAHALALFIVNLTDTPKDNDLVSKGYRYIELVAGIVKASKVKQ